MPVNILEQGLSILLKLLVSFVHLLNHFPADICLYVK